MGAVYREGRKGQGGRAVKPRDHASEGPLLRNRRRYVRAIGLPAPSHPPVPPITAGANPRSCWTGRRRRNSGRARHPEIRSNVRRPHCVRAVRGADGLRPRLTRADRMATPTPTPSASVVVVRSRFGRRCVGGNVLAEAGLVVGGAHGRRSCACFVARAAWVLRPPRWHFSGHIALDNGASLPPQTAPTTAGAERGVSCAFGR